MLGVTVVVPDSSGSARVGFIIEIPSEENGARYLVVFNDGTSTYTNTYFRPSSETLEKSKFVSHLFSQPRVLVKLKQKDKVLVERAGEWVDGVVESMDASIATIRYDDGSTDDIYQCSIRLYPVHSVLQREDQMAVLLSGREKAGTIRKAIVPEFKARVITEHECSSDCMPNYIPLLFRGQNPLLIPLRCGWRREAARVDSPERVSKTWAIFYTTPCARRLRFIQEVAEYLARCESNMEIDSFSFDPWVNVRDEFKASASNIEVEDITQGKELNPLPAINTVDSTYPPHIEYSCQLQPKGGVEIPVDPEFLAGCSCTDNCANSSTCSCVQLTIKATALDKEQQLVLHDAGYDHRRLKDVLITGIFECNSRCSCSSTCHNRVHQQPIRVNLQVFRTEKRGWGVRALHDIPQGTVICQYVGNLFTSVDGNEEGQKYGDDYFCELDLIELVERTKEGYESDVTDIEDENSDERKEELEKKTETTDETALLLPEDKMAHDLLDGTEDKAVDSSEKKRRSSLGAEKSPRKKLRSIRKYYPEGGDQVYIVDAMKNGNVGRYFNHSCDPNIFVQNVFQETHDLRFPTVAFFTCKFVKAGEELCWNYNYTVGSVEGRKIDCHCGADICKKRLL